MLLGLSDGSVWVEDTRANFTVHTQKVLDCAILKMTSTVIRVVIQGTESTTIYAWDLNKTIADLDYDASDPNYFFAAKPTALLLDGYPSASDFNDTACEAIVATTNGSFWLCNFLEGLTVKLKSCHCPDYSMQAVDFKYVSPGQFQPTQSRRDDRSGLYEFDQNYVIASAGKDGVIKVWNMFDLEHCLNFIVPKEECLCIAAH